MTCNATHSLSSGLYILWDTSTIWGLMALRAVQSFSLPCRLVKAQEIAQGLLSCKPPAILLVPGGAAKLKSKALGRAGRNAIRGYVRNGGCYLGFCGGAGFGLTAEKEADGLGLCPWHRAAYGERLQHLISGHALATVGEDLPEPAAPSANSDFTITDLIPAGLTRASLPVWWPGRFAPEEGTGVHVLARYLRPDTDFWVADLPLASVPLHTLTQWKDLYGVNLSADFLTGQPVIVHGRYGAGSYILSYSHLETPDSPQANAWLAHLLERFGRFHPAANHVPAWEPDSSPVLWPENAATLPLIAARHTTRGLLDKGIAHSLFFRRTQWLAGWRAGIPGAMLNSLYTGLCTLLASPPTPAARACWDHQRPHFEQLFPHFLTSAEDYLLAERLRPTLAPTLPEAVSKRHLQEQREALFGHAMAGGGMIGDLLAIVEELVFLQNT